MIYTHNRIVRFALFAHFVTPIGILPFCRRHIFYRLNILLRATLENFCMFVRMLLGFMWVWVWACAQCTHTTMPDEMDWITRRHRDIKRKTRATAIVSWFCILPFLKVFFFATFPHAESSTFNYIYAWAGITRFIATEKSISNRFYCRPNRTHIHACQPACYCHCFVSLAFCRIKGKKLCDVLIVAIIQKIYFKFQLFVSLSLPLYLILLLSIFFIFVKSGSVKSVGHETKKKTGQLSLFFNWKILFDIWNVAGVNCFAPKQCEMWQWFGVEKCHQRQWL